MTTTNPEISRGMPYPRYVQDVWRELAHRRLTNAYKSAKIVPFNNQSRFIFFSDCHRGDNGRFDAFKKNKSLYLHAMQHYLREGFTYIEVGDGDELWYNLRFSDILKAHGDVFDLLHTFRRLNRLHVLAGNHDTQGPTCDHVVKDGIKAHESLLMRHEGTGRTLFVVHGHQADLTSWKLHVITRFLARSIWKKLKSFGIADPWANAGHSKSGPLQTRLSRLSHNQSSQIEERIIEWAAHYRQKILCGHTHMPAFASAMNSQYFNSGCCVTPGYLTGLEIQNGQIQQIRWRNIEDKEFRREEVTRPQTL